ncbi:signal recognition particle receptor FtsY [Candidatus Gastranaerophilus sp. (ex Termes propinquus)]|nr:signal recognition particle receptor FtsY [Candidatus Gastranaerophilus sp. (ex Termes propinquus)]
MFDFFKKKPEASKSEPETQDAPSGTSAFGGLKEALSNTSKALVQGVLELVGGERIDEYTLEDIETLLIKSDLGVDFSVELVEKIREKNLKPAELKNFLKQEFLNILESSGSTQLKYKDGALNIYFVTGVNGAGKTTLIGKLAHRFKQAGKKVLIAAGDTFRAAAEEQLDIWAKRAGVDIVRKDRADSASIVYEAIQKAQNEHYDIILVDTAGRLQSKFNLIEELKKIKSVIDKNAPGALSESILVLDANLGQNGLSQAKVFTEAVNITSCAMTKLDGSAKGGIILAVAKEFKLPTKLIGVGEKIEDLRNFSPKDYIDVLFD